MDHLQSNIERFFDHNKVLSVWKITNNSVDPMQIIWHIYTKEQTIEWILFSLVLISPFWVLEKIHSHLEYIGTGRIQIWVKPSFHRRGQYKRYANILCFTVYCSTSLTLNCLTNVNLQVEDLTMELDNLRSQSSGMDKRQRKFDAMLNEEKIVSEK